MKPVEVRSRLVEALVLDIVGPRPGSPYEAEVLPQAPSRWYLTSLLVPYEAKAEDLQDESDQELDLLELPHLPPNARQGIYASRPGGA